MTTGVSSRVRRGLAAWSGCVLLVTAAANGQTISSAPGERLTLEAALEMARDNNRHVQTAQLEVDKAEANVATARTRRLPSFEADLAASQLLMPVDFSFPAGAFGTYPPIGPIPSGDTTVSVPREPTYYVFSQVSQPVSQLFQINLAIKSAVTARDLGRERLRAEELTVANRVKHLYFAILQTQSALTSTEEAIALYRELTRTLDVRVAQKVALRADALDVQFRLAQEELTRTTRQNALASQKEQLNELLGRDVRTPFEVEDVRAISIVEVDLQAAQAQALESRPDVRQARLTLQQAELDRRIAKADRIPDVSVAAAYVSNFNISVLPKNLATLGVRLKWEPFDWGRRSNELAAKTHTVQQARLGVRDAEDRTVIEINSRFRALSEKRALLNVASMAQASAREKLREKTNQYQLQAVLLPDVLQVRSELATTNDRYQQALLDFWIAKADYELAVGEEGRK
jgi:outer membrane protein